MELLLALYFAAPNFYPPSVYRSPMRSLFVLLLLFQLRPARAQRTDPDQQPYWTRYTFVEDSNALVPLKGAYRVYYMQSGMWWNMLPLHYPVTPVPGEEVRLKPLFGKGFPSFQATPARGKDLPDVKVVVVRDLDTMVVELSVYYRARGGEVDERCKTLDCKRRPPMVVPFRPGRYLPIGRRFTKEYYAMDDAEEQVDARTVLLTEQFDVLWKKAMEEERIIPQLNTDTCWQDVHVPADLDLPDTNYRDAWVIRSPYCGTHFARFPAWGTGTTYIITFIPYLPDVKKDPVTIGFLSGEEALQWVDMSDWPVGDHSVSLFACGNGGTFTLKLR